jgi:four helix bundle protein
MKKVEGFEDLVVWQEAKDLAGVIYKTFNGLKDFGFKDQIQRASISVMNNIAEGFERGSDADFLRFLYISKASCGEVRSMIYLAKDLNYIKESDGNIILENCRKLARGLASFIKYLKRKD